MNIFVVTDFNGTIPITVETNWTVGDLCREMLPTYSAPVLSYQGVELKDLSMPIADTGICSESVVEARECGGALMFIKEEEDASDSGDEAFGTKDIAYIIDTENEEICCIDQKYYSLRARARKLRKIDYEKYQYGDSLINTTYEIGNDCKETLHWGRTDNTLVTKLIPIKSLDIKVKDWDEDDVKKLRQKYNKLTFNITRDDDESDSD